MFKKEIDSSEYIENKIYIDYAICLRNNGDIKEAENILNCRLETQPENEELLVALRDLYNFLREWKLVKSISIKLIKLNSEQSKYHFFLGKACSSLNEQEEAKEAYKTGLEYKHNIDINQIKQKVVMGFTNNLNEVNTEYH